MTGKKRRFGLAVLSFPLVLSALLFVLFWAGIFLGIVPLMCAGPRVKLLPAYFWSGMVLSVVLSGFTSRRFHRWMVVRREAEARSISNPGTRTGSPEGNSRFLAHYARMKSTRTPRLGPEAGHFMFWKDVLAGYVDRASKGERWENPELFGPDSESVAYVAALRSKAAVNADERAFLEYYDFLLSVAEDLGRAR